MTHVRRFLKSALACMFFSAGALCAFGQTAPSITKQPADGSVSLGAKAVFFITASGSSPINYQWRFNSAEVPGATKSSLTLTNILAEQAGEYRVLASNAFGSVTSAVARLDVETTFTKIADPIFNIAGGASGVSWVDFNRDGRLDLMILAKGSGGMILTNDGRGRFGKLGAGAGFPGSGLGSGSWADINNDGVLDVFLGGANLIYLGTGTNFVKGAATFSGANTYCAAWGDYDNDGFVDLFAGNYYTGGQSALFHNKGDGTFTRITTNILAKDTGSTQGISWADYDNDGKLDLFVAVTSGQKCFLYHNLGGGNFEKITNSPVVAQAGNYACGAWGDYDNDGFPDLFVCGYNQQHRLFHNEGNGTFKSVTNAGSIATDIGDDQACGWADYDNDGFLDLFVCGGGPTHGMKDFLYHNNGDGTFTKITRGSLVNDNGEGGGAAWGDYNRDGFPDLFVSNWQNMSTGDKENYLYLNNGNSNAWLTIRCAGRVSNTTGIGAKVRVKARIGGKETWQLREISGGGAYISQHSPEAMFGLGDATNIAIVRVEWPSGMVQELTNVAPRQLLTAKEPSRLRAVSTVGTDFIFDLEGGKAAYRLESSADLKTWSQVTDSPFGTGRITVTSPQASDQPAVFFRTQEMDSP